MLLHYTTMLFVMCILKMQSFMSRVSIAHDVKFKLCNKLLDVIFFPPSVVLIFFKTPMDRCRID